MTLNALQSGIVGRISSRDRVARAYKVAELNALGSTPKNDARDHKKTPRWAGFFLVHLKGFEPLAF
jgi:hypothetical protein